MLKSWGQVLSRKGCYLEADPGLGAGMDMRLNVRGGEDMVADRPQSPPHSAIDLILRRQCRDTWHPWQAADARVKPWNAESWKIKNLKQLIYDIYHMRSEIWECSRISTVKHIGYPVGHRCPERRTAGAAGDGYDGRGAGPSPAQTSPPGFQRVRVVHETSPCEIIPPYTIVQLASSRWWRNDTILQYTIVWKESEMNW